ncbi:hypothetical protein DPQ22_07795 [Candidatus Tokpelaia sp.]|nr:hypothetical protein DPQ22_07795 [Candidatus Tokpelaia sp.]
MPGQRLDSGRQKNVSFVKSVSFCSGFPVISIFFLESGLGCLPFIGNMELTKMQPVWVFNLG